MKALGRGQSGSVLAAYEAVGAGVSGNPRQGRKLRVCGEDSGVLYVHGQRSQAIEESGRWLRFDPRAGASPARTQGRPSGGGLYSQAYAA